MADLVQRFNANPILTPADIPPSREGFEVTCVLNPGAFQFDGRTAMLMRVAERPPQTPGMVSTPILDPAAPEGLRVVSYPVDDPELDTTDPRIFEYKGMKYLTTLSHLRLAWSDDGHAFTVEPKPALEGEGPLEVFGVEDARVTLLDGVYHITYTAVSGVGVAVGLRTTTDWQTYTHHGIILPPDNKDVALFEQKFDGQYVAFHRPICTMLADLNIWLASSPDLVHWGRHRCIARVRKGMWDGERIGAGATPIRTEKGWLEIYHGADRSGRYCLGALLLDLDDPARVLARSEKPLMEPTEPYEAEGFFCNCVFTNGHVVDGDTITMYYGASDSVICGATMSIDAVLASLL